MGVEGSRLVRNQDAKAVEELEHVNHYQVRLVGEEWEGVSEFRTELRSHVCLDYGDSDGVNGGIGTG